MDRRGRRSLRGGVNPSVFLARKIDLTFRQGMQPSQALCASSPGGRAKGWGAFLRIFAVKYVGANCVRQRVVEDVVPYEVWCVRSK